MKIFLDTSELDVIEQWLPTGLIDGITTNPSLISKQCKGKDAESVVRQICDVVPGDVSIEVVAKDPDDVYRQAKKIAAIAPNAVVKIPFAKEYLPVMHRLVEEEVSINVTLVFSLLQALCVAKIGVSYISPFVGRWDDVDINGIQLIEEIMQAKEIHGFESEILAASLRHLMHWHQALLAGVDVVTLPPQLLEQAMHHPLTLHGMKKFEVDWKTAGPIEYFE